MAARPANPALAGDILRVTADLIEEKGPDSITMREVAERLGISATTIYLYYKDKDELVSAAVDRAFEWFGDAQEDAERSTSGADVLRARSHAYAEWGMAHPNLYRAMFERGQTYRSDSVQTRRRSYFAFGEAVQRLVDAGELRSVQDVWEIVNLAWATNHGLVSLVMSGRMFGPIGTAISAEDARKRLLSLVDAAFDEWMRAWGGSSEGAE